MKTLIKILPVAAFIIACSGGPKTNGDRLLELRAERDSLKAIHKDISKRLKNIDYQISELDTTKKVTLVTTLRVEPKTFVHYFDVRGNIKAEKNSDIFPETMGNVIDIKVFEGEEVKRGQVLMILDASVVDNQIKSTESSLELAKSIYEKQSALYEQGIGSEVQYLQAKTNMETLSAQLEALKAQRDMAIITAPFNGIVDEIFPKIGTMAGPTYPVIRMISLDKIYIHADVSESYIGKIRKGTPAVISFPVIEKEVKSSVNNVGNYINPNNRTFKIRLNVPNTSDQLFKPNMISVIKIQDYKKANAIILPASIIQQDAVGNDYVYVVEKNGNGSHIAKRVDISTGYAYKGEIEITNGLSGNEQLIDKGARIVKDGQKVKVTTL
jgi:RND family efflux transporter MFP subunit